MAKAKLGSGGRFKALQSKVEKEGLSKKAAGAVAAAAGRAKYGNAKMNEMAQAGKKRAAAKKKK